MKISTRNPPPIILVVLDALDTIFQKYFEKSTLLLNIITPYFSYSCIPSLSCQLTTKYHGCTAYHSTKGISRRDVGGPLNIHTLVSGIWEFRNWEYLFDEMSLSLYHYLWRFLAVAPSDTHRCYSPPTNQLLQLPAKGVHHKPLVFSGETTGAEQLLATFLVIQQKLQQPQPWFAT